jgi:hypothetical protein
MLAQTRENRSVCESGPELFMKITIAVSILLVGAVSLNAQLTRQDWLRADEQTVRLKPSAFRNLPSAVRTELEHRGCTIPQPSGAGQPRNAVSGSFITAGQTDWAVLCSRDKRSTILVFRSGTSDHVDQLAEEPDLQHLQVISRDNKIGYSRMLTAVNPQSLRSRAIKHSALKSIDHDGIEDAFIEKASLIWYWSGVKWVKVPGAD